MRALWAARCGKSVTQTGGAPTCSRRRAETTREQQLLEENERLKARLARKDEVIAEVTEELVESLDGHQASVFHGYEDVRRLLKTSWGAAKRRSEWRIFSSSQKAIR